jgi:predicted secreted protein
MWRFRVLKAAAAAATLFAFSAAVPVMAADVVKIGILWPLTGNAAAAGQASKAAAEVAVDIINNAHPELGDDLPLAKTAGLPNMGGAKLELVFVDHQGNPSLAQQLATRLITQDKVDVLMGAYQSSCMGYEGVKFDNTGQNILAATYLIQLHDKKYELIWPDKAAEAKLQWPMAGWKK